MKLTLGTTYYNSPDELKLFIFNHIEHVDELIIVDDGSQIYPAIEFIESNPKLKLYVVEKDYGFNSHGCRNLIMKESSNDWVILLDIDRKFIDPELNINAIRCTKLKSDVLYRFVAMGYKHNVIQIDTIHESVNDYLVNKNHFFKAGGYDEELIGYRTGDREYFEQLKHFGKEHTMHDVEILLLRPPTQMLKNNFYKSNNDKINVPKNIQKTIYKRISSPEPNKPILTFEWKKIF